MQSRVLLSAVLCLFVLVVPGANANWWDDLVEKIKEIWNRTHPGEQSSNTTEAPLTSTSIPWDSGDTNTTYTTGTLIPSNYSSHSTPSSNVTTQIVPSAANASTEATTPYPSRNGTTQRTFPSTTANLSTEATTLFPSRNATTQRPYPPTIENLSTEATTLFPSRNATTQRTFPPSTVNWSTEATTLFPSRNGTTQSTVTSFTSTPVTPEVPTTTATKSSTPGFVTSTIAPTSGVVTTPSPTPTLPPKEELKLINKKIITIEEWVPLHYRRLHTSRQIVEEEDL